MPNDFDQLLAEYEDDLDPEFVDRLKKATAGSPLRKERDTEKQRADKAEERAKQLEGTVLKATFGQLGIKTDPAVLRLPDDLDVLDAKAIQEWAVTSNLIDPPEPTEEEQRLAADLATDNEVARAGAGAQAAASGVISPATVADWSSERWARFAKQHPDAAEQLRRGEEVHGITF